MKTIFFNRVFWQHQAFWLGVATFVSIWGLWLVCPPAVVAGNQANQALCQQRSINYSHSNNFCSFIGDSR